MIKLGLDVLAIAKRGGSNANGGGFKAPKERATTSFMASIDEEEEATESSGLDEVENDGGSESGVRRNVNRRYRETSSSESMTSLIFKMFYLIFTYLLKFPVFSLLIVFELCIPESAVTREGSHSNTHGTSRSRENLSSDVS